MRYIFLIVLFVESCFGFGNNILINNWNCIGIKDNINFKKPYTVKVGDLPLVIWKNKDGKPVSAINICKHMGSSFDKGTITKDGCLECPYHGLKYKGDDEFGKVIEQDGKLFWSHNPIEDKPVSFPFFNSKKFKKAYIEIDMDCSLPDSAYNSLDLRHPEFVHNGVLGFGNSNPPINIKLHEYNNKNMFGLSYVYKSNKLIQYINSNSKNTGNFHLYVLPTFTWSKVTSGKNNKLFVGVNFLPIGPKKTRWYVTIVHNYKHLTSSMMQMLALPILKQDQSQLKHQYMENGLKKLQMFQYKYPKEEAILKLFENLKKYQYPDIDIWTDYIKLVNNSSSLK